MNKLKLFVTALVTALAMTIGLGSGQAALLSVGGTGMIIGAPASAVDDAPGVESNTHMLGFDEKQSVFLTSALTTDQGVIAAGTWVDSHMILLNTRGTFNFTATARWGFSGIVLGTMSDVGGLLEAASNSVLGNPGTTYPGSFRNRGLEGGDPADFVGAIGGTFLSVGMHVTEPGDWIRVITAVPTPGTLILLGLGLLGLGFACRRRLSA